MLGHRLVRDSRKQVEEVDTYAGIGVVSALRRQRRRLAREHQRVFVPSLKSVTMFSILRPRFVRCMLIYKTHQKRQTRVSEVMLQSKETKMCIEQTKNRSFLAS